MLQEPPFVYKGSGGYTGYSVSVLDYIAKQLNFKYKIREPSDKTYGNLKPDGSWSGMIGEVARGVSVCFRIVQMLFMQEQSDIAGQRSAQEKSNRPGQGDA